MCTQGRNGGQANEQDIANGLDGFRELVLKPLNGTVMHGISVSD